MRRYQKQRENHHSTTNQKRKEEAAAEEEEEDTKEEKEEEGNRHIPHLSLHFRDYVRSEQRGDIKDRETSTTRR